MAGMNDSLKFFIWSLIQILISSISGQILSDESLQPQQDSIYDSYHYQVVENIEIFIYLTTDLNKQINTFEKIHPNYIIIETYVNIEKNLTIIIQKRKNE